MDNLDTGGLPSVQACLLIIFIALFIYLGVKSIDDEERRERGRRLRHVRAGRLQARRIKRKRSSLLDSRGNKMETDILAGLFDIARDTLKGSSEETAQSPPNGEDMPVNEDIFCETVEDAQKEVGNAEEDIDLCLGSDLVIKKRSSKPRMSKRRRRDWKKAETVPTAPNSDLVDKISNGSVGRFYLCRNREDT